MVFVSVHLSDQGSHAQTAESIQAPSLSQITLSTLTLHYTACDACNRFSPTLTTESHLKPEKTQKPACIGNKSRKENY